MQAPVKTCPQCGLAAALPTPFCPQCGYTYRTQFGGPAPPTPLHLTPPRGNSSFGATAYETPSANSMAYCSQCHNVLDRQSPFCRHCGADQRTLSHYVVAPPPPPPAAAPVPQYAPPGYYAPPPVYAPSYPTMYSPYLPYAVAPDDFEMIDLSRQYRESNKTFIWSLVIGLLLFLPLLILSYSEWKKMKAIKSRVALRGIDPERWITAL